MTKHERTILMLERCFQRQWAGYTPGMRELIAQQWHENICAPGTLFAPPEGAKHVLWGVVRPDQKIYSEYVPHSQQLISLIEFPSDEAVAQHVR